MEMGEAHRRRVYGRRPTAPGNRATLPPHRAQIACRPGPWSRPLANRRRSRSRSRGIDPGDPAGAPGDKDRDQGGLAELRERARRAAGRLYAESQRSLLVVLQAMDAGGKDGTDRAGLPGREPAGRAGSRFKAPDRARSSRTTSSGASTAHAPRAGRDRRSSTARTTRTCWSCGCTSSCPRTVWRRRYEHIRDFEDAPRRRRAPRSSSSSCTSPRTSRRERLQERLDDPTKHWKFNAGRPRGAQALGRLPGGLRGRARRDVHRATRRGTSSPPTASGTATGRSYHPGGDAAGDGPAVSPAEEGLDWSSWSRPRLRRRRRRPGLGGRSAEWRAAPSTATPPPSFALFWSHLALAHPLRDLPGEPAEDGVSAGSHAELVPMAAGCQSHPPTASSVPSSSSRARLRPGRRRSPPTRRRRR